jgi:serine/threonine-protein kinase
VIGTTLNQRFSLDKELGRGGMGAVYRATDQVLQRHVAVKILKDLNGEEVGRRLRLEAQILARLMHENIVRLYDFSEDQGTFYFIMEEVDGTSLQKRWKKVPLADRLRIVAQVAEALDYAHHQGVIHRDIKPANVLLTSTDQAKLSDFGLSILAGTTDEAGIVRGTPHYMSPEQAKGKKLDHRTDLYSLGVVLYECATGTPPFNGPVMTIMAQQATAEPDRPRARNPEVSEELEALIMALMAKAPEARPGSGREAAERIRDLVARDRLLGGPAGANGGPSPPTIDGAGPASVGLAGASASAASVAAPPSIPAPSAASLSRTSRSSGLALAKGMLEAVEAEPVVLTPDERYYCGHYLAYLLGGSRRKGFFLRRPLDPLNADRGRLLLAMTYLTKAAAEEDSVARAADLMRSRIDVRPALSPIVVRKYLAGRETPAKRKRFRQMRQQLQLACEASVRHLLDDRGVLNPGLMPQVLSDLARIAPEKTEVDDQLVLRWNRVTEVWRNNPEFRESVLRYATRRAWRDPASGLLWPEVVYPLIERARWQRRMRSTPEAIWDRLCGNLHIPDAGNRMDRAIERSVPEQVAEQLDVSLHAFVEDPELEDEEPAEATVAEASRPSMAINPASFQDLGDDRPSRGFVRLAQAEPVRFTLGELRTLWQEGIAAMRNPDPKARAAQRTLPIGPYRLAVVPSIRSRAAGQLAIRGMPNKQVEMLIPPFTGGGSNSKPVVAAWPFANNSLAVTYLDHLGNQRFIFWDATTNQQTNFDDAAHLNHTLYQLGLEAPDALDRVLSKGYRPRNPV